MNHNCFKFKNSKLLFFLILFYTSLFQSQTSSFQIGIFDPPSMKANFTAVPADYNNDGNDDVSVKTSGGYWLIDYADPHALNNGFGGWDQIYMQYGNDNAIPVPGDYDGDGKLDLAVKTIDGLWLIDFASNGLGGWDQNINFYYGGQEAHPVPGYYNNDSAMDIAVKTDDGFWRIDYADPHAPNNGFGGWDAIFSQYGGSDAHPVPADYNGDGLTDLSVKTDDGRWLIDFADQNLPNNGFGGWEVSIITNWLANAVPVPGDYNGDGLTDLSVKTDDGKWLIDFADANLTDNGFGDSITVYNEYGDADAYPITADYDGDGTSDISIKSKLTGEWIIDKSSTGLGGWDFPLSLSNYTDYTYLLGPTLPYYFNDLAKFKKVKDAYVDFLISPDIMFTDDNYARIYAYLELAKQKSLKVLLSSHNIASYQNPDNLSTYKQEFLERFKNNLPLGLDESIMGIFLGDEPNFVQYDNVSKWTNFFKQNFPEKPLYYNLFPRYWGDPGNPGSPQSDSEYENYLNMYINSNETDFVSYDHYPLRNNEPFRTDFFYNMKAFKDKIGNSRPFWFVVQSHKGIHGDFTLHPYEPKLKFITSSAIAYGAKGLLYWSYMNGVEEYPSTYASVQKVNKYLKEVIGPIIMNSNFIATMHKSDTYMNQGRSFGTDELVDYNTTGIIKDTNNDNILLALYEKPATNYTEHYIWVVNKDLFSNIQSTTITINGGNYRTYISPRVDTYTTNNSFSLMPSQFDSSTNTTVISIPELLPGEGIMIKLVRRQLIPIDNNPFLAQRTKIVDKTKAEIGNSFNIYPNPANDFIEIDVDINEEILSYSIYNMSGHKIMNSKEYKKIDIRNLPSGSYILELSTKSKTLSKKFLKN